MTTRHYYLKNSSLFQGGQGQTTQSWVRYLTPTSIATNRSIPVSSPTPKPAARLGTTAISTEGKRRSSAPTELNSPKLSLYATGGSTSAAAFPSHSIPSTNGCTGGPRSTPPARTGSSPKSSWRTYSSEMCLRVVEYPSATRHQGMSSG